MGSDDFSDSEGSQLPLPPPEGFSHQPEEPVSMLSHTVGVPRELLQKGLDLKVGNQVGRMAISPELQARLLETIDDPELRKQVMQMPTLDISIVRKGPDTYEITVGVRHYEADSATIKKILEEGLEDIDGSSVHSDN